MSIIQSNHVILNKYGEEIRIFKEKMDMIFTGQYRRMEHLLYMAMESFYLLKQISPENVKQNQDKLNKANISMAKAPDFSKMTYRETRKEEKNIKQYTPDRI